MKCWWQIQYGSPKMRSQTHSQFPPEDNSSEVAAVGAGYCWGGVEVRSLYPGLVGIHCAVFLYGIVSAGRSRLILFLEIIYETCLWGAVHRTGKRVRSK